MTNVIFRGRAFTIEWYVDEEGSSPARQYYEGFSIERRVKFMRLIRLMGEFGKIHDKTKFRNEGDQIYAFKPQPNRYLCFFFTARKIIITSGFHKKSDKLPKGEKERALKYRRDYVRRVSQGAYYEKD